MSVILHHSFDEDGAIFWATFDQHKIPYSRWGQEELSLLDGSSARIGVLNLLIQQTQAMEEDGGLVVLVPHAVLAGVEAWQAKGLGLPKFAPFRLAIKTHGTLSNPSFHFDYGFLHPNALPVELINRQGVELNCLGGRYLLPDPLFSVVTMLDAYRNTPIVDMDERFLWWSRLRELLPADVEMGNFLRSINVVKPESFTLDFAEREGRLVIVPRFVISKSHSEPGDPSSDTEEPESFIPPVVQGEFSTEFLNKTKVGARFGLGRNWFVVIPHVLRLALQVVRDHYQATPERQRAFLHNPRGELRQILESEVAEADLEDILETIFVETPLFLSERIKCLGVWEPKAGMFIKTENGQWLPGSEMPAKVGIMLGNGVYTIDRDDLAKLVELMRVAVSEGKTEVKLAGVTYPVSPADLEAVERAANTFAGPERPEPPIGSPPVPKDEKLVPVIFDHIQELGIKLNDLLLRERVIEIEPRFVHGVSLHQHQKNGFEWLKEHWRQAWPGALLADDMGLGKTLQTLAFLSWVKLQMDHGAASRRPILVVAPTGLLKNWEAEAQKFLASPGLGTLLPAYGSSFSGLAGGGWSSMTDALRQVDWVLTTYETLRDKILGFTGVHFSVVVFDEAQKIKNPKAMLTEMAKSVKSEFTLALTGTPVENSLVDLWCIVDAVRPGYLSSLKDFAKLYMPEGRAGEAQLNILKNVLDEPRRAPIMLRRSKEEHWHERPGKIEKIHERVMPLCQSQAYSAIIQNAREATGKKGAMLEALQALRAVSLHPSMHDDVMVNHDAFIADSARLSTTFQLLDNFVREGSKALVFVEYLHMQSLLSELIVRRYGCPQVMIINGEVSGQKRQSRVDEFQRRGTGFDVMILSPKAGGVGLNLTAATHVIHLSRWWNPAVEDQCTDRAYRIGQGRSVTVHYPLAVHPDFGREHSFDVKLHQLLTKKRHLSRALLAPPAGTGQDVEDLFTGTVGQGAN